MQESLKRTGRGNLRNGMAGMANPPPKATPESFCFLLFLFGCKKGLLLWPWAINMAKAQQAAGVHPLACRHRWVAHFRDSETPGSTHRSPGTPPRVALAPGWGHCQGQGQSPESESSGQERPWRPRTKPAMSSLSSVPRWQQGPPGPKGWSHLKVEDR